MCFTPSNFNCSSSDELFGQNITPQSNSFYTNFNYKKQTSMQKMYKNTIAVKFVSALILSIVFAFTSLNNASAQTMSNYSFSYNSTGSLDDLSTGATSIMNGNNDDAATAVYPLGMNFAFMGTVYTHFSANSNGQMQLHTSSGATAIASNQSAASGVAVLAPMFGDNEVNNGIRYITTGSAPNRKFVLEWNQFYVYYSPNLSNAGNMQVWLDEATGTITYMYGEIYNAQALVTTRAIGLASSNTATTTAWITVGSTPTITYSTAFTANSFAAGSGLAAGSPLIANLGSSSQGSRVTYIFTPPSTTPTAATNLTFTSITGTGMTLNWTDSPNESFYAIYRSTDGVNYTLITSLAANTTTYAATGLTPGLTYYWRVASANEVKFANLDGSQASSAAATYYYVGGASGDIATAANWTTNADGTGTTRSTAQTTDILIVDGAGVTAGSPVTLTLGAATSIGSLQITSNTAVTLQSSSTTTRALTLTGSVGDELSVGSGSSLIINNSSQAASIAFSTGTGMTGTIAGTLTLGGSTSNIVTTTGGTGTLVTVTGTVNLTVAGSTTQLVGSATTLSFSNGSNCNVTGGTTTTIPGLPLATWGANSTVTINNAILTTGTSSPTNAQQSFGNFVYNCPASSGTISWFTSSTTLTIQGNLTVTATNTGRLRVLTSGTLNIAGNLNINGGTCEVASSTGTLVVAGNVNLAGGTLDMCSASSAATLRLLGNFVQTGGTLTSSSTSTSNANTLHFNGTTAQTGTFTNLGANSVNYRVNNAANVTLNGTLTIQNGGTLTISNGNLIAGTSASVVYNSTLSRLTYNSTTGTQTANSLEFPSSNGPTAMTINNTAASPNNTVTVGFARSLASLTLTSGLLVNGNNTVTITGTTTGSVSGGSASTYVQGKLERTLPASLVTGSTYVFPVGKSGYNPYELVNPTTNAGGTVVVSAEVFDANSGGTAGNLMSSINTSRYWAASITSGSANFTNTFVRLNDTRGSQDAVAASATLTGAYDQQGGVVATNTTTSILTTAPAQTALPGYYLMGNLAAASLGTLNVNPSGNQCTNVARNISVVVTPGGAAVSTVTLSYQVNGGTVQNVSMTNTTNNGGFSADTWTGTIPTVSPVNGTVTWSVTAVDGNSLSKSVSGTSYTDEPLAGITATASASSSSICSGGSSVLTAALSQPGSSSVSNGATTEFSGGPFRAGGATGDHRAQYLYTAAELTAAGFSAGNITSLSFNVTSGTSSGSYVNYTVGLANTSTTTLSTTFVNTTGTQVYFNAALSTVVGANTFAFGTGGGSSSSFYWDGTSNLLVNICYQVPTFGTSSTVTASTGTTGLGGAIVGGASSCTGLTGFTAVTARPQITISGNKAAAITSVAWTLNGNSAGSTNPLTVSPTNTPAGSSALTNTYTAAITALGCTHTTTPTVNITINALPTAPNFDNTSLNQCGTITYTVGGGTPGSTYKFYTVPSAGTAIATNTTGIYTNTTPVVGDFNTVYVSVTDVNTGCTSDRTQIDVFANTPADLGISQSTVSTCVGRWDSLSVTTGSSDYDVFTWAPTTNLFTNTTGTPYTGGSATKVYYRRNTATASETITLTAVNTTSGSANDGCTNVASAIFTVNANPTIAIATATPSSVCSGSSVTLNGQTNVIGAGTASVGAGGTTSSTSGVSMFSGAWGGEKVQYIVKASELTAAGISAGNITSLGFEVSGTAGQQYQGFNVSIGHTALSAMVSGTSVSSGLTQVYLATEGTKNGFTPVANSVNTLAFGTGGTASSFNWDGTSNILISFCWSSDPTNSTASSTSIKADATGFTSSAYFKSDNLLPAAFCALTSGYGTSSTATSRPKFTFGAQVQTTGAGILNWSWSNGTSNVLSAANGTVNPTNTPAGSVDKTVTYTVTGTSPTAPYCAGSLAASAVTVKALAVAPTDASTTPQCGTPTFTVTTGLSGFVTYKWYDAASGGNLVTTTTSSTGSSSYVYTGYTPGAVNHLYVTVTPSGGCESGRTDAMVTVNNPPTLTINTTDTVQTCVGNYNLISVTQGGTAFDTYVWTANTNLFLTNTGTAYSGNPTTVYYKRNSAVSSERITLTATNNTTGCINTAVVVFKVGVNPIVSSVSITPSTLCNRDSVTLRAAGINATASSATLGAGGTTSTSVGGTFFPGSWGGAKTQYIIKASELNAQNIQAGNITSLGFEATSSGQEYQGFTVSIGHTNATVAPNTTFINSNLVQVYKGTAGANQGYTPTVGVNTLAFGTGSNSSSSFNWDGTSNIVVTMSWSRIPAATTATVSGMKVDAVGFVSTAYRQRDSQTPDSLMNETSVNSTTSNRPKFIFGAQVGPNETKNYVWTWSTTGAQGAAVATGDSTKHSSVNSGSTPLSVTYTAIATVASTGCYTTLNGTAITVNPSPTAPISSTPGTQCGLPTFSINAVSGMTYKWYTAASGGTAISGANTASYTPATYVGGGATNTYWATVTNANGCESDRTMVSTIVNDPPSIAIQASATTICADNYATLNLTAGTAGSFATVTWSPITNLYTDMSGTPYTGGHAATVYYKRSTAVANEIITAVGTTSGGTVCVNNATVDMTVNANPSIVSVAATPSSVCSGSTVNLNGTTTGVTAGIVTVGAGATTTSTYNAPFYSLWSNKHMQILFKAAELTSFGMLPGNITTIGFPTTSGTVSNKDYTLRMKLSTGVSDMSSFVSSGFTTVYTATELIQTANTDNTFTLNTPFYWDGTSDVVMEMCWGDASTTATLSSTSPADATSFVSVVKANPSAAASGSSSCANTSTGFLTYSVRPVVKFGAQTIGNNSASYTWAWSTGLSGGSIVNGNSTTHIPTNATGSDVSGTYTVTVTNATTSCYSTATTSSVTVKPIPSAPTDNGTVVNQCGLPTYIVSTTATNPIINWYTIPANGGAISSGASLSYNYTAYTPNAVNTLYVSVSQNGCEGSRTAIAVNVATPASIALNGTSLRKTCVDRIETLSVSAGTVGNYTNFNWSPTTNLYTDAAATVAYNGTGNPTTVYYKRSTAGTEVITLSVSNNGVGACVNTVNDTFNINTNPVITSIAAAPTNVCSGSTVNLNGSSIPLGNGSADVGAQTTTEQTNSPFRTGLGNSSRHQYLFTAAELNASGIYAGNITAIGFTITTLGTGTLSNYSISMAHTGLTALTSSFQTLTSPVTVYSTSPAFTPVSGLNTYTFNTPFNWDGTSNIIINICYDNPTVGGSSTAAANTPSTIMSMGTQGVTGACTAGSGSTAANRPLVTFTGQVGVNYTNTLTWAWTTTNNAASITNGASTTHVPTNSTNAAITTSYNVTATNATTTCFSTGTTNTITVNYIPASPTSTTTVNQCGTPSYSVSTSETGATIYWYTSATGGSAISSGASTTYVYSTYPINVSGEDTLWASVSKNGCESGRTRIIVSVATPPALALTNATSVNTCVNRIETISVTGATASNYSTFTWSPTTNLYTDANATVAYNGTGNPTTVYYKRGSSSASEAISVSATNGSGCLNVKSVTFVVNANPVISSATVSSANICSGDALTLTAQGMTGTATVGTGTLVNATSSTTSTGYPAPFGNYYGGARNQMLITAADLTAAGLTAGNITSVAFDVTTAVTTPLSGFSVQVKASSLTALTSFETSGFTTVYSAATYTPSSSTGYAANTINFSTPFNWDGISNIIVQTCFYNTSFTTSGVFNQSATSYQSTLVYRTDGTDVCASTTPTVTFSYSQRPNMRFGFNNTSTLTWSWSNGTSAVQNTASGTIYPTNMTTSPANTTYTVTATDANTCSTTTSPTNATVTINPGTVGGTPSSLIVCSGFQPSSNVSLVGSVGSIIKWQKSTDITFASAVTDIVNTTTTLTAAEIGTVSVLTYLRAVVKSGACSQMYSDISTLTPVITVGGSASSQTVCYTGGGTVPSSNIVLTGYQGSIVKWQKSTDSTFTTGVVDIASNSVSLSGSSVGAINTTTYVRALVQNATCSQQYSRFGTLTAYDGQASTVTISTNSSPICSGSNTIFQAVASNPGTSPVYVWKRNGNVVGTNSTVVSFASGILQTNDVITCEVTSSNPCASPAVATSNTLTLTVLPSPAVGAIYNKKTGAQLVSTSFCNFNDTLFVADNTINGTWTSSNSSVASVTTYSNTANRYAYVLPTGRGAADITYTLASAGCASTATFALKVAPVATPATITASSSSVCANSTLQLTSATAGGTWTVIYPNRATTSNTGLITGKVAGTTPVRYTVANDSGCSNFTEYTLTVNAAPSVPNIGYAPGTVNPQIGAPAGSFCVGKKFNVVGSPTGGHWTYTNTGVATITDSLVSANNWWGNVSVIGIGSGNIVYTYTNSNGCSSSRAISGNGVTCASRGVDLNVETKPVFDFTLYPNPAKGRVSFNVEFADADGKVVLTDMYGKQLKMQTLSLGTNQIDINNLSKGFYLVSVINNDGTRTTKKLIVE